jgi:hypothetical protein
VILNEGEVVGFYRWGLEEGEMIFILLEVRVYVFVRVISLSFGILVA